MERELQTGGKVLILTPDYSEWTDIEEISSINKFSGVKKLIYEPGFKDKGEWNPGSIELIWNNFHDGLLIADDFRTFSIDTNSIEGRFLRKIWIRSRQKMLDVVFVAHGFTQVVPVFIYSHTTHIVLFKTIDEIKLAEIKDIKKLKLLQNEINNKALSNEHYYKIINT